MTIEEKIKYLVEKANYDVDDLVLLVEVLRSENTEATALGAACLAGLAVGFFQSREEIAAKLGDGKRFVPLMDDAERNGIMRGWHRAVKACRVFAEEE